MPIRRTPAVASGRLIDEIFDRARERRLSQSALAQGAGLSKASVSRIRSRRTADIEAIEAMARVLGLRLSLVPDVPLMDALRGGSLLE